MINAVLADMKSKLSAIVGIKTCKVGIEANLSPADYPIVRLVPNGFRKGDAQHFRICDLLIYFGLPTNESKEGLETVYGELLTLEDQVIEATKRGENYKSVYQKTIVSDSQVEHYRIFAVQLEVSFEI